MTITEMLIEAGVDKDNITVLSFASSPETPYAAIVKSTPKTICADGVVTSLSELVTVELYCEPEDEETHKKFEYVLNSHEVNYKAALAVFSGDFYMYEYIYRFELKEDY